MFATIIVLASIIHECISGVGVVTPEASGKSFYISCGGQKINILGARYGGNCASGGADESGPVSNVCEGRSYCRFYINHQQLGDPCVGVRKDFYYAYACSGYNGDTGIVRAEASGRSFSINCGGQGNIKIIGARYGGNCPSGGADETWSVAADCNGRPSCSYRVDHRKIGDPCSGIRKDFFYAYQCIPGYSGAQAEGEGNLDLIDQVVISGTQENSGTSVIISYGMYAVYLLMVVLVINIICIGYNLWINRSKNNKKNKYEVVSMQSDVDV